MLSLKGDKVVGGGGGGGGGGGLQKKMFLALRASLRSKKKGGAGPSGPSPGSAIAWNNDKRLDKMATNYVKMG